MKIAEFKTLTEGRQSTLTYILKTKRKIKELTESIKGMTEDVKKFLIESGYEKVTTTEGAVVCYLKPGQRTPSFKEVFESVKGQLDADTQKLLLSTYEKGIEPSQSLTFAS